VPALRTTALIVRFLLEFALLAGSIVAALALLPGGWAWAGAIGAPAIILTVWTLWLSPKARLPLLEWARIAIETALFLAVGTAVWLAGQPIAAAIGLGVWLAHRVVLALARERLPWEPAPSSG